MATRILYVITKANWGGAQRYVYDLAVTARASGYQVAVAYGSSGELAERLRAENIDMFLIDGLNRDIHFWKDWVAFLSLLKIMTRFKPDVVHLNGSKVGGFGTLVARLKRIPKIIFTAHAWAFNEERPWYQKVMIRFFAWLTVLLSTQTIVVSNAMKKQIARWPFVSGKILVIPNGTRVYKLFDKMRARQCLTEMQPKLAVSDIQHDIWIGTVAELHPVKGILYAIEAIAILRKKYSTIRYLIVGEGQTRNMLSALIEKNGLQEHVFLIGQAHEAPLYAKAYDMFLLPSLSEAFGMVLLEAGLAELPVIATTVGGIPEIISHEQTGLLVPPKNPTAIADALELLLKEENLRYTFGMALRQRVEKEFSMQHFVQETFAWY